MAGNKRYLKVIIASVCISFIGAISPIFASSTLNDHRTDEERLDTLESNLPYLEEKVLSTLMFGGSTPVQVTGEARLKAQYHRFMTYPSFLGPRYIEDTDTSFSGDRSYLQTGWEEGIFRLGLVVRPGRNTVLWSRIGFSHTLPGNRVTNINDSLSKTQEKHNSQGWPANLFEDMCAGIAIRTTPATFWLKLGSILWTEASPFTIWKAQPRVFAWEYLPYEIEQPIARYFEYNIAKGEKVGRAAWHKKAFNGINLESIQLPLDFYLNLVYGKAGEFDAFEREYMDFAVDLAYAAEDVNEEIIETGYNDSYRHIFHTRLAKKMRDLHLGFNFNVIHCSDDIIYAESPYGIFFNTMFDLEYRDAGIFKGPNWAAESEYYSIDSATGDTLATTIASSVPKEFIGLGMYYDSTALDCGRGFYKEPKMFSIDLRGKIGSRFQLHADIGLCRVDTVWVYGDTSKTNFSAGIPLKVKKREITSSKFLPAFYSKLKFDAKVALEADFAYISRGFYSPFSLASPMDAFYAFGTNLLGAGTFAGHSESSPYFQNMAGAWLSVAPKLPAYGHLKIKYGQHFQLEKARDLLFFPYRLNGMDLNSIFLSTYAKWGVGTVDFPMAGVKYDRRLGDESYNPTLHINGSSKGSFAHIDEGPEKGGLHGDYLAVFESFVPYDDPLQVAMNYMCPNGKIQQDRDYIFNDTLMFVADKNLKFDNIANIVIDTIQDTIIRVYDPTNTVYHDVNGFVPHHKKYSFNFEIDGAYDIGPLIRYKKDFFLGGYLGISGVSTAPKALAFNDDDDDMLLWSLYFRFEPAIALSKKFYIIGLIGFENWRSKKSWMNVAVDPYDNLENTTSPIFKRVPINYMDAAYGIGFDWDMLDRVGLHGRYKWMKHEDESHNANNYKWFLVSGEIKLFF